MGKNSRKGPVQPRKHQDAIKYVPPKRNESQHISSPTGDDADDDQTAIEANSISYSILTSKKTEEKTELSTCDSITLRGRQFLGLAATTAETITQTASVPVCFAEAVGGAFSPVSLGLMLFCWSITAICNGQVQNLKILSRADGKKDQELEDMNLDGDEELAIWQQVAILIACIPSALNAYLLFNAALPTFDSSSLFGRFLDGMCQFVKYGFGPFVNTVRVLDSDILSAHRTYMQTHPDAMPLVKQTVFRPFFNFMGRGSAMTVREFYPIVMAGTHVKEGKNALLELYGLSSKTSVIDFIKHHPAHGVTFAMLYFACARFANGFDIVKMQEGLKMAGLDIDRRPALTRSRYFFWLGKVMHGEALPHFIVWACRESIFGKHKKAAEELIYLSLISLFQAAGLTALTYGAMTTYLMASKPSPQLLAQIFWSAEVAIRHYKKWGAIATYSVSGLAGAGQPMCSFATVQQFFQKDRASGYFGKKYIEGTVEIPEESFSDLEGQVDPAKLLSEMKNMEGVPVPQSPAPKKDNKDEAPAAEEQSSCCARLCR